MGQGPFAIKAENPRTVKELDSSIDRGQSVHSGSLLQICVMSAMDQAALQLREATRSTRRVAARAVEV